MDWFPTILDLAEIPRPEVHLDGHSVLPLIEDEGRESAHQVLHFDWANSWAVREGDWKLIAIRNRKEGAAARYSLHNLADPQPEARNHAKERPGLVKKLAAIHEAWEKDVLGSGRE